MVKTFILLLLSFSFALGQDPYSIQLKSGSFTPDQNFETSVQKEINNDDRYLVIQFNSIPSTQDRKLMEKVGMVFEDYLPNNAYLVFTPQGLNFSLLSNYGVRAIVPFNSSFKVDKDFSREIPSHARQGGNIIRLSILTHNRVNIQEFSSALIQLEGQMIRTPEFGSLYFIDIPEKRINDLLDLELVKWVEYIEPDPVPDDFKGRSLHRANAIDRPSANGYHYDGTGVSVTLADDGPVGPHIDLEGRVVQVGNMGSNGTHGDMTIGILMGAGNLIPENAGMATGVSMRYYDISGYNHINSAVSNYNNFGTVISSTSYSEVNGGIYTSTANFVDQQIHQNPSIIHVFSAGNAGGGGWETITGGRKAAKNTIATANLEYQDFLTPSSSRGPAQDGRLKPDIAANGTNQMSLDANNGYSPGGGTSAACPGIAGVLAQLYQAYRELNGGADPRSSLMKAILLNSAEDLGNPGPDYSFGWGRVNALRALKTMEENRIIEDSVSQGDSVIHNITVPAGVSELKVMVYWLDKEGSPSANPALVNNLDMTLTDPSTTSWLPWVLNPSSPSANANRGIDNLNNMEQVTLSSPVAGTYSLKVKGTTVPFGPQNYHVVYEFRVEKPEVTYPLGGESFIPGDVETIRWDAFGNTGSFLLEYSLDNGNNWTTLNSNIPGSQKYYDWTVPQSLTGDALIRVSRGLWSDTSDANFSIMTVPQNISVRWACTDSLQIRWDSVENADSYEISQLGTKYMDSIGTTSHTYFTINNVSSSNENWFSVKALNQAQGIVGRRAYAFRKAPGVSNCPVANDLSVYRIVQPEITVLPSCQEIDSAEIVVEIENIGTTRENNFPIKLLLDNGSVFTYQYSDTLKVYESVRLRLPVTPNISVPDNFKVWTDLPNDSKRQNDSLGFDVYPGQMFSPPLSQSFDQFSNCNTASNCEATTCNLSNGWINLSNNQVDDIDWRTNANGTTSTGTGPNSGFGGSGKYLYLEASGTPVCSDKTALLMSPCIDLSSAIQPELSFWYHMFGADMGELHIDLLADGTWFEDYTIPLIGNQGNSWQQRTIDLSQFVGQIINVRFRGITGNNFTSDIAIDEINIYDNFAPADAGFTFSQPNCSGQNIIFTDNSSGTAISRFWDFGATAMPSTATGIGPHNVTYPNSGLKNVSLIVSNITGSDTSKQNLLLDTIPTVGFVWNANADTISFINQSSNATGFVWDFGDGNSANTLSPVHVYSSPGIYTVTLTVSNGCGVNILSKDITVGLVGFKNDFISNLKAYPNPNTGSLYISGLKSSKIEDNKISISDTKGSLLNFKQSIISDNEIMIEMNSFPQGLYFLKIQNDEVNVVMKIEKR